MDYIGSLENEFFKRFNSLEEKPHFTKTKKLEKDINKHFRDTGETNPVLLDILAIIEIYEKEEEFNNFEYYKKIKETYTIAAPIIKRILLTIPERLNQTDLILAQICLSYTNTAQEAEILAEKCLLTLKRHMRAKPDYRKNRFLCHLNVLNRCVKADFFEIDADKNNKIKTIFESHLDKALKIFLDKESDIPEVYKHVINVRQALMDKDSNEVVKHISYIRDLKTEKKMYDIVRDEIAKYSFHTGFNLCEKQFNMAIGVRIRNLRENMDITLVELADKLKYSSEGNMSAIERGDITLPSIKIARIADVFGVTMEELCYGVSGRVKEAVKFEEFKYKDS